MAMTEQDILKGTMNGRVDSGLKATDNTAVPLGEQSHGGIVRNTDGLWWLPASPHRGRGFEWQDSKDPRYNATHLSEVGYHPEPLEPQRTVEVLAEHLQEKVEGRIPETETHGVEVEGTTYDREGNLLAIPVDQKTNPELLASTHEEATKLENGQYPRKPFEIARAVASATQRGIAIAENHSGILVLTEVPEGGTFHDAENSTFPYIVRQQGRIRRHALAHLDEIPEETWALYRRYGVDIRELLESNRPLNWPTHGLHHHAGAPQIEGLVDPRAALVMGKMRQTLFAKLLQYPAFNSSRLYEKETDLRGVRSVAKHALATTVNNDLPDSAEELMWDVQRAMREGEIATPSRYPYKGQHDVVRFRMDGKHKTVESIKDPMTPDLLTALHLVFGNQLLDTIGQQALVQVGGDESKVMGYLQSIHPELFATLPSLGPESSHSADMQFNKAGYLGTFRGKTYAELIRDARAVVEGVGKHYTALETQAKIVNHVLGYQTDIPHPQTDLATFMGIKNGVYQPNSMRAGILTDYKTGIPTNELLVVQAEATKLQAQALAQVRDDKDLLEVYGLQ